MICTVKFTTAYKKSYKLMKKRGLDLTLLDDVVDDLRQGIVIRVPPRRSAPRGSGRGGRRPRAS